MNYWSWEFVLELPLDHSVPNLGKTNELGQNRYHAKSRTQTLPSYFRTRVPFVVRPYSKHFKTINLRIS